MSLGYEDIYQDNRDKIAANLHKEADLLTPVLPASPKLTLQELAHKSLTARHCLYCFELTCSVTWYMLLLVQGCRPGC